MSEIRRLRIDGVDGSDWLWSDVVTRQRGHLHRCRDDVAPGTEVLVEVRADGARWRVVRWIDPPPPVANAGAFAGVLVDGVAHEVESVGPTRSPLEPGAVRSVFQAMDGRSTAARDAGTSEKARPAVVVAHDPGSAHVEVAFVYGTNSAVKRSGAGRRIRDWRVTGLRKPSVVSSAVETVAVTDLGPLIGYLSADDRRRLIGG